MSFRKITYTDRETLITAENLNDIQDAIIALDDGLFSVDNDKSGEVITITDASKRGFKSFNIYGKTTQDGIPTPDSPVDLVSIGDDGSVAVTVAGANIFQYIGKATIENGTIIENSAAGGTFQGNDGTNPGSTSWSSGWAHFDRVYPLYLRAGTVVTISADYTVLAKHSSAKDKISILFASHSGSSSLDIRNAEIGVKYRISRTLTVPEDGSYTRTTFTIHSSKVNIENVQWEIGAGASDFVPYKEQTLSVSTPNGLPGVPVTSNGNYTDSNGQQWICDEIDFYRGVYVQRVEVKQYNNATSWGAAFNIGDRVLGDRFRVALDEVPLPYFGMSNMHSIVENWGVSEGSIGFNGSDIYVYARFPGITSKESLEELFAITPLVIAYCKPTPIEIPLPEGELAAYAALYTYKDNTTVSNDAVAYMELEYVMDAKKYIDNLVAAPIPRLAQITLSASAWTGANSPYSQVVSINGITEYSKVDLLPSVEQLAIFHNKDVTFVTENEDGVVTVYAIGEKPLLDYTMQVQIVEVEV